MRAGIVGLSLKIGGSGEGGALFSAFSGRRKKKRAAQARAGLVT
ncbi:hypothetical protein BSIN_0259 [Burkholderia singularis]|uniref:Uncharacterized protein n=1 Tax=Burkholderia singularis TaxID=1503053 RepID=A0A238H4F6_9BURK|nr:hypothetical protein BSIN_0259 [Burkholderia singularis]